MVNPYITYLGLTCLLMTLSNCHLENNKTILKELVELKKDNCELRQEVTELKKLAGLIDTIPASDLFVINVGMEDERYIIVRRNDTIKSNEQVTMYTYRSVFNNDDCYNSWYNDTSIISGVLYVDENYTKTLLQTVSIDDIKNSYTISELVDIQKEINQSNKVKTKHN